MAHNEADNLTRRLAEVEEELEKLLREKEQQLTKSSSRKTLGSGGGGEFMSYFTFLHFFYDRLNINQI